MNGLYDDDPMTAFLVHLWLRKLVEGEKALAIKQSDHYIKHADDKGDQFLTENDRILVMVDWEW